MKPLITRNQLDGISDTFEVTNQITVYAYGLGVNERVAFSMVALSEFVRTVCGNCPPAVVLPAVVDEMPLECCDEPIYLTRSRPWVIIDSPQHAKLRARLETTGSVAVIPTNQVVGYRESNTRNVTDRMRGCACAGAA